MLNPDQFVEQTRKTSNSAVLRIQLTEIKKLVEIIKSDDTKYKVIEAAYEIFTSIFDHNIRDLKKMFPDNHIDESG